MAPFVPPRHTVLLLLLLNSSAAYQQYVALLPNGANIVVDQQPIAAVGHTNPAGGGARNEFGTAFGRAETKWTQEFCMADSDGDGVLNGVELGDPCCRWSVGMTPERSDFLSHPGLASSVSARGKCDCSVTPCFVPGDSPSPSPSFMALPSPTPTIPETQEAKTASAVAIVGIAAGGLFLVLVGFLLLKQRWGASSTAATQDDFGANGDYALFEGSVNGVAPVSVN